MIDVVAAVVVKNKRVLIAQRNCRDHAGKWEFPGGKIEPGETPEQSLARELTEEFGVECRIRAFIAENCFDYGNKQIRLMAYFAEHISGTFECREHAAIVWVSPQELENYDLVEADVPLVPKIQSKM